MECRIEITMKCQKCEKDCESLIVLKDEKKTSRFQNKRKNGGILKIRKVCQECALKLLRSKQYDFGYYWRNFLIENRYVYFSHHGWSKQFDEKWSDIK